MTPRTTHLYIVGTPRSGTTLLAATLDRHSNIAVTPETHFHTDFCEKNAGLFKGPREHLVETLLNDRYISDLRLDQNSLVEQIGQDWEDPASVLRALMDTYRRANGKSIAAEKTPAHLHHVEKLLEGSETSRVVCIVRDGRDVAMSLLNMPSKPFPSLRRQALLWKHDARKIQLFEKTISDRFLRVHFEDLVSDPVPTLKKVVEFVGVEFEPGQTDSRREVGVVPDWEAGWKGKVNQSMDPKRSQAWKNWPDADSKLDVLNSVVGKELVALGYEDSTPLPLSKFSRLKNTTLNTIYAILFTPRLSSLRRSFKDRMKLWGLWRLFHRSADTHQASNA
ncbi:MAG TPA: hypothetical protein DDW52_23925 [Planctomycetaceae bacterium]|nr:hypothetical protein [Planctomycetaceae bacterium]